MIGKAHLKLRARLAIVSSNRVPMLYIAPRGLSDGVLIRLGRMREKVRRERTRERQTLGARAEDMVALAILD